MTDLDSHLARGPLRVRSVWTPGSPEGVVRRLDRSRRRRFVMDVLALCACIALWLVAARHGEPAGGRVTRFADGSSAEASTRDAEVRIEKDGPEGSVCRLTGGARFEVVHDERRTFEVRAGDVRVRVLGTTFSVQQLPGGQAQVLVERGRVEVAWLGGVTVLRTGQGGVFPPSGRPEPDSEPEAPAAATAQATAGPPSAAPAGPSPPPPAAVAPTDAWRDGWRRDARTGDYARAYEELNARGADSVRDDAADLMLAADIARLSGHPDDAIAPLRGVCDRHAGDRRAPVAAFTLGRVLDDLGRPAEAAAAFERARALWPGGPLSEDALSRAADAWQRAGRAGAARTAAQEYVTRYPKGRHVAAMRTILGP
jgi:transmembrane sensor